MRPEILNPYGAAYSNNLAKAFDEGIHATTHYTDGLESELAKLREENARLKAPMSPVAWVIPGDDNEKVDGSIDCMCIKENEFTKPLFAAPPAFLIAEAEARGRKEALLEAATWFEQREYVDVVKDLTRMANKE